MEQHVKSLSWLSTITCRVNQEDYSSFLPQEQGLRLSPHTARASSNLSCIRHQSLYITDFVIMDNSLLTKLSISLSYFGVVEYRTFPGLFSFTQEDTISKSASFRIETKFEPLSNPLQIVLCLNQTFIITDIYILKCLME